MANDCSERLLRVSPPDRVEEVRNTDIVFERTDAGLSTKETDRKVFVHSGFDGRPVTRPPTDGTRFPLAVGPFAQTGHLL